MLVFFYLKHRHRRGIFHILISPRLVQLVRRKARTRRRRIRLNRITFVQQILIVQAFQQPPHRLDVLIFKGHVGRIHIDPVAHFARDVVPHILVAHDGFAALLVVFIHRNLLTDVLFRDAEFLLDRQLNRQTVRIPTRFALHALPFHRMKTTKQILNRPRHHMVNTGLPVGRRRPLVKDVGIVFRAFVDAAFKDFIFFPKRQDVFIDVGKVEFFVFFVHCFVLLFRLRFLFFFAWCPLMEYISTES